MMTMMEINVCHIIKLRDIGKNLSFKSILLFMLCKVGLVVTFITFVILLLLSLLLL